MLQVVFLLLVVCVLVYVLSSNREEKEKLISQDGTSSSTSSNGVMGSSQSDHAASPSGNADSPSVTFFDPNTADSATLVAVGLSPFQAHNVLRYRQKGGQYHRPDDFKRLYGLTVSQWEHLEPLIRIGRDFQYLADVEDVSPSYPSSRRYASYGGHRGYETSMPDSGKVRSRADSALHSTHPFQTNTTSDKLRRGETIDLSRADTTLLKRVPGIGSYYAKRIVDYADKLGGFVSLEQLNDDALSFLPTDIDAYLTLHKASVRKLRINQLSVRELVRHPYITYAQAKQIANRVRLSGPFTSWDDLLFLSEFTEADRQRLEPYVEF